MLEKTPDSERAKKIKPQGLMDRHKSKHKYSRLELSYFLLFGKDSIARSVTRKEKRTRDLQQGWVDREAISAALIVLKDHTKARPSWSSYTI